VRVVLGTNVLVAAFGARGLCEAVHRVCLARHEIALREHSLQEVRKAVCVRLKVDSNHADSIVTSLRDVATLAACQADRLITGDPDVLALRESHPIAMLWPRDFHDGLC